MIVNNMPYGDKPKNYFNETKYKILALLYHSTRELSPQDIADEVDISLHGAKERLRMLNKFGYIWRKVETRKKRKNFFSYMNLKPKGERVLSMLDERIRIQKETGITIPLNLKKSIPEIAKSEYNRIMGANIHD